MVVVVHNILMEQNIGIVEFLNENWDFYSANSAFESRTSRNWLFEENYRTSKRALYNRNASVEEKEFLLKSLKLEKELQQKKD